MLKLPRFKPHLRVHVVPGEGAFVLADSTETLLRGRLYELVAPRIGGGRSPDDVCELLQDKATPAEVYFVLDQLERKGYLCEEADAITPAEAALWSSQQVDPSEAVRRLSTASVAVRSFGTDAGPFLELLDAMGVRVEGDGDLLVVLADDYLRADLAEINAEALRSGRPWLLTRPVGREIWTGPLFRPGASACWECLARRLRANRPVASYLESRDGKAGPASADLASSPATLRMAAGLAANAVATWIARGELAPLEGAIRTFDVASWQVRSHATARLPYCPACGQGEAGADRPARPIELQSRPKTFTRDGGHRVVEPEATLEKYGHHVSPLTGAVTMLERVGPASGSMHVYIAGHNLARHHGSLEHLRGDLRNMASGKGASDAQAKASGLCEGLERFSGVFRGDEPRRTARAADLGGAAIDLRDCLLFSDRQYRERDEWNARKSHYNFVPLPYDPDAEIEWTPAWSLTRGEPRYLPTGFCYFNYHHPRGKAFCLADSNGNAAGNTIEEAILQGFLELVERDSVALWWYSRCRRPGVDLDGFAEPYYDRLRDQLRADGRELWAIDLTSDLGVPVFAALTRDVRGPEERIILGFGAHLDAPVALLRAVTEMNQMLAHSPPPGPAEPGKPDRVTDPETLHWLRTATLANQPYLLPDDSPPRAASAYPRSWAEDVADDVRTCREIVEGRGMEMLVLDQTREEIGLPVVKVIVPGLRHFWARFAPGRLYDVPARLGWVPRRLAEDELNPIPMFL